MQETDKTLEAPGTKLRMFGANTTEDQELACK
jgi:hypothetical protein